MTKRLFLADSVFWLVSMPEGTPSETMWPAFAFWDDDEEDCVGLRHARQSCRSSAPTVDRSFRGREPQRGPRRRALPGRRAARRAPPLLT